MPSHTPNLLNCSYLAFLALASGFAHAQCATAPLVNTCSYTGLNSGCTITINRAQPITPPTIYVKRNKRVTVVVLNPSPFETLSFDLTSVKASVPFDAFQAFMQNQSASILKFSAVENVVRPATKFNQADPVDDQIDVLAKISDDQRVLLSLPSYALPQLAPYILEALQPLPADACAKANAVHPFPSPWYNLESWKQRLLKGVVPESPGKSVDLTMLSSRIESLDTRIANAANNLKSLSTSDQIKVGAELAKVTGNQNSVKTALAPLLDLVNVLNALTQPPLTSFTIPDPDGANHNSLQATWTLNFVNTLSPAAKRVYTPSYKPGAASDAILTPPAKQAVVAITAQYQAPAHIEFSTGIMVPLRPFHSYSTVAIAAGGTITGNVVQQTLTYTVVPLALVNFSLVQGVPGKQPLGLFATIGTGYNPATTSVEFGVGPTFSFRSIELSALADIGRDTQLSGGFTVGQTFAASTAPKPLTVTGWFVKPAVALSVRIPIGGSQKPQ